MQLREHLFRALANMHFFPVVLLPVSILSITLLGLGGLCSARTPSAHDCVSSAEASKYVGTSSCVTGTVSHVEDGRSGTKILNFCKSSSKDQVCPFTVVVFPADLKKMGDIRQLEGRQIEIKGTIQDYDGRPEIVLRRSQQLGQGAFLLFPQVPTDYDVERPGHSSAGRFSRPKAAKKSDAKQTEPLPIEDPNQP